MKNPSPGITEIARRAGVSTATVSRALNGSGLVRPEVRERIRDLARELNYHPNSGARSLRRSKTETIALVNRIPSRRLSDPFLNEFTAQISTALTERGYDLLFVHVAKASQSWLNRLVSSRRVDGIIITHRAADDADLVQLGKTGIPFVVLGRPLEGQPYCSVGSDNFHGGNLVGEHLLSLGHRRLAAITMPLDRTESWERVEGFVSVLREAGITVEKDRIIPTTYHLDDAARAMEDLLARPQPPTAFFVGSDLMALAAMEAATRLGVRVPDDISIVGFDDVPIATYFRPALTTVHQDIARIGTLLVERLVGLTEGQGASSETVPVQFVVRGSTGPVSPR